MSAGRTSLATASGIAGDERLDQTPAEMARGQLLRQGLELGELGLDVQAGLSSCMRMVLRYDSLSVASTVAAGPALLVGIAAVVFAAEDLGFNWYSGL